MVIVYHTCKSFASLNLAQILNFIFMQNAESDFCHSMEGVPDLVRQRVVRGTLQTVWQFLLRGRLPIRAPEPAGLAVDLADAAAVCLHLLRPLQGFQIRRSRIAPGDGVSC